MPLGQIDMPTTFGDPTNYRMQTLTFEVVAFHETYHAILGRPCFAKFMAVPNYTYHLSKVEDAGSAWIMMPKREGELG